jgi:ARG/rhodanese/phosphatase superfamily protein
MRFAVAIGAVVSLAGCNYEQLSQPEQQPPSPAPRVIDEPARVKPIEPAVAKVDLSLGSGLEMRRPLHDGRLTLIPIVQTFDAPAQKFITLQEGMANGQVLVHEMNPDWLVDTVHVQNRAKVTLVVMSGEMIEDAMQDRVTAEATVIPAGESRNIAVRCVEEDRDHGGYEFHASHMQAELTLRRTVMLRSQDDVWARVKRINRAHNLFPKTNTYRYSAQLQTSADGGKRRDTIVDALMKREERSHMVGLAVAIDGKIVAIDRFASPELYRAEEPLLLAAYLPDSAGAGQEAKALAPETIRAFQTSAPNWSTPASFSALAQL